MSEERENEMAIKIRDYRFCEIVFSHDCDDKNERRMVRVQNLVAQPQNIDSHEWRIDA